MYEKIEHESLDHTAVYTMVSIGFPNTYVLYFHFQYGSSYFSLMEILSEIKCCSCKWFYELNSLIAGLSIIDTNW